MGEEGCAFLFTDAAREDGSGFGGFTLIRGGGDGQGSPRFLFMAEAWDATTLRLLQGDVISMPAGECFGAAEAVVRRLRGLTHLWRFTDSVATKAAITSGSSGAPQLDYLVTWLARRSPGVQFLAVHVPGVRNVMADKLSRDRAAEVHARRCG